MKSQYLDFCQSLDERQLKEASKQLALGKIGVFPTDTVYGIGCDAFHQDAILQLFKLKHRTPSKPISVLISDIKMLEKLTIDVTEAESKLMKSFWPGPLTIIFRKNPSISNHLTANLDTIGIRMPNHKIALKLIEYANTPIATTSANLSDKPDGTCLSAIASYFKDKVSFLIDDGPSPIGVASTIVKMENNIPHILREGSISEDSIRKVLERS